MPPLIAAIGAVAGAIGSVAGAIIGVGAIGGIAGAAAGAIGFGALGFIATAIAIGSSLLRGGRAPSNSQENVNRLRANIDVRTPRKTVFGVTALATDIRDEEFTNDQTYFHRFIAVASHKVHAVSSIYFDDKLAWTVGGGVQGEFVGYLTVAAVLEGSAANAINIGARMGSTRRYTGCAYVHLRYQLTGGGSSTDSPFAQSITTRITIIGDGAYCYDPRLDSTVPGGAGAHRADNQSTWAWNADACRNPAIALLFYLLGWRITNPGTSEAMLAVGKGIPQSRIDLVSFAVAANICDELVTKIGGGTEPRYRCDGVWSEGDAPNTVIDMLKATMNADLDDIDGKLRVTIFHNDLAIPDADFTDDDIIGEFEWNEETPLDQSYNIVRGVYTDASTTSLYQTPDYPQVSQASPDGLDRIDTFDLPMVQSAGQAQRLAQLRLLRRNFGGTFKAVFQATAWAVQKNSVVRLTFTPRGFVNKLFRVAEMELRTDGTVPLLLVEEDASIYGAPSLNAATAPIATTPYNPALNPIISAIDANASGLGQTYIVNSWQDFAVSITGTTTTATINTHDRIYSDSTVSVTGTTITGLTDATTYYLYYDDGDRSGGAVTWVATTDYATAQNSATNSGRHYGGVITTGASAVGFGVLPPGSYYYP